MSERLIPDYQKLYDTMVINKDKEQSINFVAAHIKTYKDRYVKVGETVCSETPVPWYFIGLIHHMESGQSFNRHLHNGDPLTARTIHVPIGRPLTGTPPFTWDYSANDALRMMGYGFPKSWDIPSILSRLEAYNGLGYQWHNVYSPYLWSFTNHYQKGRFNEVFIDNKDTVQYNENEVSQEVGCAPILHILLAE